METSSDLVAQPALIPGAPEIGVTGADAARRERQPVECLRADQTYFVTDLDLREVRPERIVERNDRNNTTGRRHGSGDGGGKRQMRRHRRGPVAGETRWSLSSTPNAAAVSAMPLL